MRQEKLPNIHALYCAALNGEPASRNVDEWKYCVCRRHNVGHHLSQNKLSGVVWIYVPVFVSPIKLEDRINLFTIRPQERRRIIKETET